MRCVILGDAVLKFNSCRKVLRDGTRASHLTVVTSLSGVQSCLWHALMHTSHLTRLTLVALSAAHAGRTVRCPCWSHCPLPMLVALSAAHTLQPLLEMVCALVRGIPVLWDKLATIDYQNYMATLLPRHREHWTTLRALQKEKTAPTMAAAQDDMVQYIALSDDEAAHQKVAAVQDVAPPLGQQQHEEEQVAAVQDVALPQEQQQHEEEQVAAVQDVALPQEQQQHEEKQVAAVQDVAPPQEQQQHEEEQVAAVQDVAPLQEQQQGHAIQVVSMQEEEPAFQSMLQQHQEPAIQCVTSPQLYQGHEHMETNKVDELLTRVQTLLHAVRRPACIVASHATHRLVELRLKYLQQHRACMLAYDHWVNVVKKVSDQMMHRAQTQLCFRHWQSQWPHFAEMSLADLTATVQIMGRLEQWAVPGDGAPGNETANVFGDVFDDVVTSCHPRIAQSSNGDDDEDCCIPVLPGASHPDRAHPAHPHAHSAPCAQEQRHLDGLNLLHLLHVRLLLLKVPSFKTLNAEFRAATAQLDMHKAAAARVEIMCRAGDSLDAHMRQA
jgi:hypothetical protein